jgi:hypothetical protein
MKRKISITVLLICSFAAAFAFFKGIGGNWTGALPMGRGNTYPLKYTFSTDDGKLTGLAESAQGNAELTDGKIHGDSISFAIEAMGMTMLHTGKYFTVGDSISLNILMNGQKYHATLSRAAGN